MNIKVRDRADESVLRFVLFPPAIKNGSKSRNSATGTKIESAEREQSSEREELVSARVFSGGSTKESIQNRKKENSGSIMCV